MADQNDLANRTIPKNHLQSLMNPTMNNISLQEFDKEFDQIGGTEQDMLIDDDMMGDEDLNNLGDGLMVTEMDHDLDRDDELPDMDDMEFNENPQPQKKKL